jgi:hypothetical protein
MAIFEYKEGEHPGGFIGFRVVCTVGDEYRQKYFSLRKAKRTERPAIKKTAEALEAKWAAEAAIIRRERAVLGDHPNVKKVHATGYTGLRCVILCEKKKRAGEMRTYYAPAFVARGNGEKAFRVSKFGYEKAWQEAVKYYSEHHELPKGLKPKILKAMPDKAQFKKIRNDMKKRGHDVPADVLSNVGL